MSISYKSEARVFQRLIYFKYYIVLKGIVDSLHGLNLPKLPIIAENASNKLLSIKFLTKKSVDAHVYLPQEWSQEAPKIDTFQTLYCTEMGN